MQICIYVDMYLCRYIYTYIYMYIYICTYIYVRYIYMQICIYVVMFLLLTSHSILYRYDQTIYLHQKELFWAYGKFGFSLPQNYSILCFMICCRQKKVILTLVIFFQKSFVVQMENSSFYQIMSRGRWKFSQVRELKILI